MKRQNQPERVNTGRIHGLDELIQKQPEWRGLDFSTLPSPAFVVNRGLLENNLKLLKRVQDESGAKILLALKGFAMYPLAKLVMKYLAGTTASGLHELLLGSREFGGERHVFSPSFDERNFGQIVDECDHIVFNTPGQYQRFKDFLPAPGERKIHTAIRVNPGYSEVEVDLYNPCAPFSRLGTVDTLFHEACTSGQLEGIDGIHFHSMCEQDSFVLEKTLNALEERYGDFIKSDQCAFVNFGGGHHITRPDYDIDHLIATIRSFKERNNVDVYLEPGEAIGLNTGVLVSRVLDTQWNGMDLAIMDTSASTHMPDVLEMPYRPHIYGSSDPAVARHGQMQTVEGQHSYRLGGLTCLAGDVIGDYGFAGKLEPGDMLIFSDMAHYSMVKTTTFNGVELPSIVSVGQDVVDEAGCLKFEVHRTFGYEDYKTRLG